MSVSQNKTHTGFVKLMMISLTLSLAILYCITLTCWLFYGYDHALYNLSALLKANGVSINGLKEGLLSNPYVTSLVKKLSAPLAQTHINQSLDLFFQKNIAPVIQGLSSFLGERLTDKIVNTTGSGLSNGVDGLLKALMLLIMAIKLFLIKALILIASIPLFILLGFVGLVDGLSMREIRRAELARESSYLFHMLNLCIARIIGLGLCVWICMPVTINPQWVFVPLGLLFSAMLSVSASKFKKYL